MSLYAVDKIMREVIQHSAAREAFAADPKTYVKDRDLTAAERAALIERDFTTLYSLGGHPFLLVGFVVSQAPPAERASAADKYQATLVKLGYPDYST
jgi:hypothetical protein